MKRERTIRTGTTFPVGQGGNCTTEPEEAQAATTGHARGVETDRAVFGEYFFQNRRLRTISTEGETWFFAAEVCEVLEIANTRDALGRLEADEKGSLIPRPLVAPRW
jgi:hypothetical protein